MSFFIGLCKASGSSSLSIVRNNYLLIYLCASSVSSVVFINTRLSLPNVPYFCPKSNLTTKMKIFPLFLLLFACSSLFAQTPSKSHIISSHDFYYGTGVSSDENRAREEAIRELSEMISVTVKSNFELRAREANMQVEEFAESIVNTYTTATLEDVAQIRTILPDGQTEIFCYMSKAAVAELYAGRAEMAYRMFQNSLTAQNTGNLAMALKQLYFANLLIKSIPDERVFAHDMEISLEIPRAINRIIQGIQFTVAADRKVSSRERQVSLEVSFGGKPVSLLHFRFWDGNQIVGNSQVRDGKAMVKLVGNSVDFAELKVHVQYEYYNARREFQAVEKLWELVELPKFENQFTINLSLAPIPPESVQPASPVVNIPVETRLILEATDGSAPTEKILLAANSFISVLESGQAAKAKEHYGNDLFLYQKLSAYMDFNRPQPAAGEITASINTTRTGFEVRNLMVNHQYPSLHKQATEFLVLDFDTAGVPVDFNLCIADELYEKFVSQAEFGDDWGNRREIIKFIEKYRTAFHTRDIQTINLMFAEDALILIGRMIQPRRNPASEVTYQPLPGQPDFVQIQYTKREYLENQQRVFDKQKDILIDFSTFEIVKKNNAPNVYGVEMRQNYSSTTYADEGYLFLLIDFNGPDPLIYIRAWQPNEWDSAALVNSSNFRIYK
jgi:hypothetical protein